MGFKATMQGQPNMNARDLGTLWTKFSQEIGLTKPPLKSGEESIKLPPGTY
jgi:hypothetical protein